MRSTSSRNGAVTAAAPDLRGHQIPRINTIAPRLTSAGYEAVELAATADIIADAWQAHTLDAGLGERADGKWSAFEVGLVVARQNGKDEVFLMRELAGLFLFGEELILHSAHEFKTAQEHFRRVKHVFDNYDAFRKRVARVRTSHGEEGIELTTGQRIRFVARSTGSGRGFSGDCLIFNEAFNLPGVAVDALMPTLSARPNPQIWVGSSPGDKDLAPCDHLGRLRRRGIAGTDPSLTYLEWSIEPCGDMCPLACTDHDDPADPESWAKANPSAPIRISWEHIGREYASMGREGFLRERLGVGNYPSDGSGWDVISEEAWSVLVDRESSPDQPVAFALDVTPDRAYASIAVAGRTMSGQLHVEVVEHRSGTHWVVERVQQMTERWKTCAVVVDQAGPAGSLIAPLEAAGVEVVKGSARIVAQACGQFYDAVRNAELRHIDQGPLTAAVEGAKKRPLGDAWAWDRKGPNTDISPLVAATLAAWGHTAHAHLHRSRDVLANIW